LLRFRTLDQQRSDQMFPRNGLGVPILNIIAPNVQVHGSRDIDPGLIRINSAYGYMKAYDNLSQQLEPNARPVPSLRRTRDRTGRGNGGNAGR
jgi:hypothetical protein